MRLANVRWLCSMCVHNTLDEKPDEWASTFQFGIFVSAPQSRDPNVGNPELKLEIPTLHVIGKTDAVVAPESSKSLAAGFVDPNVFLHAGGHYIPTSKEPKDAFRDFFKQLKDVLPKK